MYSWRIGGLEISIILGVVAILLVMMVFYLLTLQKAFSRCAPQNRAMSPGLVWLTLIPIFGLGWEFVVVMSLARSLRAESVSRNMASQPNPGVDVGLAMCTLQLVSVALRSAPDSRALGILLIVLGVASIICWIIYWVQIAGYSGRIALPYVAPSPPAPPTGAATA